MNKTISEEEQIEQIIGLRESILCKPHKSMEEKRDMIDKYDYQFKAIKKLIKAGQQQALDEVEKKIIGKDITIEDVANWDLPDIYNDIEKARKSLWEIVQNQNALKQRQRDLLKLLKQHK